jgi:hypothetical protein
MKNYQIFKHPDNRLVAVKEGFSFWGLFLGGFWLLRHQIWLIGCIAIIVGLGVYGIFPNPEGYILGIPYGHKFGLADILNIGTCAVVGFFGNEWRSKSLGQRGFDYIITVKAETPDGAKASYLRQPVPEKQTEHYFDIEK